MLYKPYNSNFGNGSLQMGQHPIMLMVHNDKRSKIPFAHERLQMGQKMDICELGKL